MRDVSRTGWATTRDGNGAGMMRKIRGATRRRRVDIEEPDVRGHCRFFEIEDRDLPALILCSVTCVHLNSHGAICSSSSSSSSSLSSWCYAAATSIAIIISRIQNCFEFDFLCCFAVRPSCHGIMHAYLGMHAIMLISLSFFSSIFGM